MLLFALDTIAILRFDFLAKNREKINFEQSMKDYRSLRDIWLENKKNLMQKEYLPAEDSEPIQNDSEGEVSQKNELEETSSEE